MFDWPDWPASCHQRLIAVAWGFPCFSRIRAVLERHCFHLRVDCRRGTLHQPDRTTTSLVSRSRSEEWKTRNKWAADVTWRDPILLRVLIPFVTIGTGIVGAVLLNLFGILQIVIDELNSYVATGIGFVKWKIN